MSEHHDLGAVLLSASVSLCGGACEQRGAIFQLSHLPPLNATRLCRSSPASPACWSRSRVLPSAPQRSCKQVPAPRCRLIYFQ